VVGVLESRTAPEAVAALRDQGVLAAAMDAQTLRFTTHRDVSRADCERAAGIVEKVLG
jgi:threonine aldolase